MEPVVGVEPTTYGLQNRCSTTELNWLLALKTLGVSLLFSFTVQAFAYSICIWYVLFSYEIEYTNTNQEQNGCGLDQNTVSQPYPL